MSDNPFDQNTIDVIDENQDFLAELVGEGKKFADVQALAKGKAAADAHITSLERSLSELREDLKNRGTTQDLLDAIKALKNEPPASPPPANHADPEVVGKPGLTEDDIERLLAQREEKSRKAANLNTAVSKLKEQYGNQYTVEVQKKAAELGVTTAYMQNLAETSPQLFAQLFPARQKSNDVFSAPPQGQRSSVSTAFGGTGEKYSDFDKIRKSDPHKYHTPAFQQSLNAAILRAQAAGKFDDFMNS